jgi:hypothetical protein
METFPLCVTVHLKVGKSEVQTTCAQEVMEPKAVCSAVLLPPHVHQSSTRLCALCISIGLTQASSLGKCLLNELVNGQAREQTLKPEEARVDIGCLCTLSPFLFLPGNQPSPL